MFVFLTKSFVRIISVVIQISAQEMQYAGTHPPSPEVLKPMEYRNGSSI